MAISANAVCGICGGGYFDTNAGYCRTKSSTSTAHVFSPRSTPLDPSHLCTCGHVRAYHDPASAGVCDARDCACKRMIREAEFDRPRSSGSIEEKPFKVRVDIQDDAILFSQRDIMRAIHESVLNGRTSLTLDWSEE